MPTDLIFQIRLLRDDLSENEPDIDDAFRLRMPASDNGFMHPQPTAGISLLNSASPLTTAQILSMIPSRKIVDRHISHFFNGFDLAPCE